ncbi:hypothetical protein MF628_003617 [Paenibacillus polymyxa]|uniref:hypothetical protein n=1 Tax=Paenibacillus polymyxa TaxID=1406 RepID=UPI002023D0B9|nr:hypothetical protein [Paenibacillus polymyxa]URJ43954.1 hypothetical protein MF628_003617 [Paenibacillus polymyxa]
MSYLEIFTDYRLGSETYGDALMIAFRFYILAVGNVLESPHFTDTERIEALKELHVAFNNVFPNGGV